MSDPFQFIPKGSNKANLILQEMLRHIQSNDSIPAFEWAVDKLKPISEIKTKEKVMWQARGSEEICITEMSTRHLFFTLRLVYNNLIPLSALQLDFDARRVLRFPSATEGKRVLAGMFEEIGTRDNLTESQLNDLTFMAKNTRIHL